MGAIEIISTIMTVIGSSSWILIFSFYKKKSNKSTYDIIKITTSFTMAFGVISCLILLLIANGATEFFTTKWCIVSVYFILMQSFNSVSLFNIYSFIFENRHPKIDVRLPQWLSAILGFLLPFGVGIFSFYMDKTFVIIKPKGIQEDQGFLEIISEGYVFLFRFIAGKFNFS